MSMEHSKEYKSKDIYMNLHTKSKSAVIHRVAQVKISK